MAQLFKPSSNTLVKVCIVGGILLVIGLLALTMTIQRSPYITGVKVAREQPIAFSHEHHVSGLGIDCRYCHTSVEKSNSAGMPSAHTCMTCHSQIWTNAEMLEPLRESYRTKKPVEWTRVHKLPDYVYFNHSIHIAKGVACTTCHGQVGQMPLLWKENTLYMEWCLSCHRNPAKFVGRKEDVFKTRSRKEEAAHTGMRTEEEQMALGNELIKKYHINPNVDCTACHR